MIIDEDKCIGCESCLNWCPMGAIRMGEEKAAIDQAECVECNVCRRVEVCPVDAFVQKPLEWPRSVRAIYSDPLNIHKETGLAGRGTEEIKTNDVTGRFKRGQVGVAIEVGRPGLGTRLKELEKLSIALARYGVVFEPKNPLTNLINLKTGELPAEIREEKVLSAIIEIVVEEAKLAEVLSLIRETAKGLETVISMDVACRAAEDGTWPCEKILAEAGFYYRPNAKVNVGLGKPFIG
ncbi:MAG: 4Fe-4S dicluster domain-containing protein [Deltaproteobacteria bacterium]|nr:4Fe-4S dicluster domain-containing protein [Deltaproteobacteria bacterium]